ncbi:acyltransferase family protein [Pedobacter sp. HMF7647]|uniref:Acyltransferase family protein n=1 Tax=Hufsiella arboris TaxID=2695275 RepID=A0A7K1YDY7_9SPHI|nr:acyltransferase family protein [Hufsiella arboris]
MLQRNQSLDFLRFIAILIVLLSHSDIKCERPYYNLISPGYLGVELFFVLSGFLVSGLIINEYTKYKSFNPKLFLIRRGFKIYPSYYIFLTIACVYQYFTHRFSWKGMLSDAFFLSNYTSYSSRVWFWSLSFEEHFYILLCILSVILIYYKKFDFKWILVIYSALLIFSICFRFYNYTHYQEDWKRDFQMTHGRLDSIFFGVVIYLSFFTQNKLFKFLMRYKKIILTTSLLIIISNYIFLRDYRILNLIYLSLNSIAFGFVILILMNGKYLEHNKMIRRLAYLGQFSYSIYLIHPALGVIAQRIHLIFKSEILYLPIYLLICFITGIAFSKIVEYPFLSLRDRYFPSRSKITLSN